MLIISGVKDNENSRWKRNTEKKLQLAKVNLYTRKDFKSSVIGSLQEK